MDTLFIAGRDSLADAQDLMRDFGGEAAGGLKLFLAQGEFASFRFGAPLAFDEDLHAVTASGH